MRVTGAADPTVSVKETMKGKLPQKKLVRSAAHGYSSYGNQIGLATGQVKEIYHPDYVAKRMEIGADMGAAPRRALIREKSHPGDIINLLGYHNTLMKQNVGDKILVRGKRQGTGGEYVDIDFGVTVGYKQ